MRAGGKFGIAGGPPQVDFAAVMDHVRGVIAAIAPADSQERFEGLGVRVIRAAGRFVSAREIEADGQRIRARRFVVATGSSPGAPPLSGLDSVPWFTNETIFDNRELPEHLIIIGGGPIGMEMAQAHRRLGARVTIVEKFTALGKDDPELTGVVLEALRDEGVEILDGADIHTVSGEAGRIRITLEQAGKARTFEGSHLLVAAGRLANVAGLGLEEAGIDFSARGITVDHRLRTTNKRVFAIGDVTGGLQFTHVASYHAGVVLKNALFRLPARADHSAVPWVTYTDPELAHVGLTEAQACDEQGRKKYGAVRVLRWPFADNDRARAERRTDGLAKVIVCRRGRVLGASLVGAGAGELIQPWVLAVGGKLSIGDMANMIAAYPTRSEINKRVAGSFYTARLFSATTRRLVRALALLG